jgi:hypothetical protein
MIRSSARSAVSVMTVAVAALVVCTGTPAKKKPAVYDDADGYAVLSFLLGGTTADTHGAAIRVNAITKVEGADSITTLRKCVTSIPNAFQEAADDYVQKSKSPYLLQNKFALATPPVIVKNARTRGSDMKHPPRTDEEILKKITSGTIFLLAVGFDHNKTHAIVFEDYICGSLCGWGTYHFLVKSSDGWKEEKGIRMCSWQY